MKIHSIHLLRNRFVAFLEHFLFGFFQYNKKWLLERRSMSEKRNRSPLLNHRNRTHWNDTRSMKTSKYSKVDIPKSHNSRLNDVFQQTNVDRGRKKSENDVTFTMPTTATTTTTGENDVLSGRRRTDLLTTATAASTMPTNRMANVTPISVPALANNNIVKAVIENPDEQQPNVLNRTRIISRTNRRITRAAWGRWYSWTSCSRSCGGGVMSQSRECLSR